MKAARRSPRWALSFADLCLLLLGFFVLLLARPEPARLSAGLASAFAASAPVSIDQAAIGWFEPGEAILKPAAREALRTFVRGAGTLDIASRGTDAGASRFDGWELAAARTAAVAREAQAAGVRESVITVAIAPGTGRGQRIFLRRR